MLSLNIKSLELVVLTDASFAGSRDYSPQIGYIKVIMDKHKNIYIIYWPSIKCERVIWIVLASELYAMARGFDTGAVIKSTICNILKSSKPISFIICIDSRSPYDCLVNLGTNQGKKAHD